MSTLRRYLLQHDVKKKVALLVQRQASLRLEDDMMLVAKDVPALETLATGIRHRLHSEICQPFLRRHQLFQLWQHLDSQWFEQFCSEAVEMQFLRPEDELFLTGSESTAAFFRISGEMVYTQVPESSPVLMQTKLVVDSCMWLSESTLWVHWIHVGKMEATTRCQMLAIQVAGLKLAMQEHYTIRSIAAEYGKVFSGRVLAARPPDFAWPSDLSVPFTAFGDVVVALPSDMQTTIGSIALDHCKNRLMRNWKNLQVVNELRQEVEDGRSIVILGLASEIERVVSLATMHIVREDGRILVQLARWDQNEAHPDLELPSTKCSSNESSDEAAQRLLATYLAPLEKDVFLLGTERETTEGDSARYGVRTLYMRKIFYSRLTAPFIAPVCVDVHPHAQSGRTDAGEAGPDAPQEFAYLHSAQSRLSGGTRPNLQVFENVPVHFLRWAEEAKEEDEELLPLQQDNRGMFCAWLREADLSHLKALNSSAAVRRWVSTLRPPDISHI